MTGTQTTPSGTTVWPTVWAVLVGGLAVLFDTTIVAVGLPTLARELHAPVSTIQWVSTGYLLALAVTVPVTGWAQRVVGSRRLWVAALTLFLLGSVLSSLAWDAPSLIAFRLLQGVGGGVMLPLMSTLVIQAAGGQGLGRVMSVVSLPSALGPIAGPVLGGVILAHLHWSWMFWVNVPFCVGGLVLALRVLPADGPPARARLDVVGLALMGVGLALVLWGLSDSAHPGGFGRTDAMLPLATGVLLLLVFTAWALRRRDPVVDLRLLRHGPLAVSSTLLFVSGVALYGAMVLLPLSFQDLRGASVLQAGALLVPQGVGTLASRGLAGRLSDTVGSRRLVAGGFLLVLAGTAPFALAGPTTGVGWLVAALVVRGVGLGAVTIPVMALGFRGLDRSQVPDASIISRVAQQVGGSFGTAVLTVALGTAATGVGATEAFRRSFWWAVGFTVLGLLVSLALPGRTAAPDGPVVSVPVAGSAARG